MGTSRWVLLALGCALALDPVPPALAQDAAANAGDSGTAEAGTYLQTIVSTARDLIEEEPRNPALAAEMLTEAASAGNVEAMILLARLYADGDGVARDYGAAERLLNQAIAAGNVAGGSVALAELYRDAEAPFGDPAKAVAAYEAAVALGDPGAMLSLARMLASGDGIPTDFGRAEGLLRDAIAAGAARDGWSALAALHVNAGDLARAAEAYQQAADLGDAWARLSLAQMLAQGNGVPVDFERARQLLEDTIAAGGEMPKWGWGGLGDLYRSADEAHRDPARAVEAYETAIGMGNVGAMVSLGRMLGAGDGVPVDFERARQLLEDAIAAEAGRDAWAALAGLYAYADDDHRDLPRAVEAYQRAADLGDGWAMLSLAQILAQGNGVPVDFARARQLLENAIALGGDMPRFAWAGIGDLYRFAAPPDRDPARAVEAYETAIAMGNPGAMVSLARMVGSGDGVPVDFARAEGLLTDAIAAGVGRDAWAALAALYANADDDHRDLAKAAEAYQQAADLGDGWAMISLAQMLGQGNGVPVDFARARQLLEKAIAGGGDLPQFAWAGLGDLYRGASPPDRDPANAAEAYETAISLGNAGARVNLARMVGSGDGVPVDFARAETLLTEAIAEGVGRDAWAALAALYANADDDHRDLAKAAEAYQQAADLGDGWAMISLSQMLGQGNGVPVDFERARQLLEKAIAAGGDLPQFAWAAMGDLYRTANPPGRDPARAAEAYEQAIALGNSGAMVSLGRMLGSGDGIAVDFARAEGLFEDAIAAGSEREGWSALGPLYANADAEHRDLEKAAAAYRRAADLGDPWSMLSLAQMLGQGNGVPADFAAARALIDRVMAAGGEMPQFAWAGLGDLYRSASPPDRDPAMAVEAYETAIAMGNTGAMVNLGRMLGAGDGVPVDFGRAESLLRDAIGNGAGADAWSALAALHLNAGDPASAAEAYQTAADLGDAWAMISLAQMLGQGNGVPADFERARQLLEDTIAVGGEMPRHAWAGLGDLYRGAPLPHRDPARAVEAYETAIALGNTGAMVSLARMLGAGEGVPADFARAESLLGEAISAGAGRDGWAALAALYAAGGANRDAAKAAEAYQQAADLGDPWAMISLAQMVAQGDGVPVDFGRARVLLDIAIVSGLPGPGAKAAGDLYTYGPEAMRDGALALQYYELAAETGDGSAHFAVAEIEARDPAPARAQASIARHLRAAADILGVMEVGRAMFNLSPVSTLYVMVQALLVEEGHRVQVDGVFGNQTKAALGSFCAEKGLTCQTSIISMGMLSELLAPSGG